MEKELKPICKMTNDEFHEYMTSKDEGQSYCENLFDQEIKKLNIDKEHCSYETYRFLILFGAEEYKKSLK